MSKVIKAQHTFTNESCKRPITLKTIKPAQTSTALADEKENIVEKRRVSEARKQAAQAEKEALELREQAKRELEQVRKQISEEEENSKQHIQEAYEGAKERGYQEGFEKGTRDGEASYEAAIEEAKTVIVSAKEEYEQYLTQAEPVILDLGLKVAERIVHETLASDKEAWTKVVEQAVLEVKEHDEIKIYVAPSQFEDTRQQRKEIENLLLYEQNLVIFPDSSLEEWSCIIETPYGKIDASLDSQLHEIKTILKERLKMEGNDESS